MLVPLSFLLASLSPDATPPIRSDAPHYITQASIQQNNVDSGHTIAQIAPEEPVTEPEQSIPDSESPDSADVSPEPRPIQEIIAPDAPEDLPTTEPTSIEGEEETEAEIFERVFGRPPIQSQAIAVPFFINEQSRGQLIVFAELGRVSQIQAAPLLEQTAEILRPDLQDQLAAAVDDAGNLNVDAIQQTGIGIIFDQNRLELYVQIPPVLRRTNVVGTDGLPPEAAQALAVSRVSGYLNLRGGQNFTWSGDSTTELGRQPLRLSVDGAINIEGWVFEGLVQWDEEGDPALTRGDLRIVRDDPSNAIRYVAGDLSLSTTSFFQSSVPMLGLSVSRNYALQPYRVTRPLGEYTFFLERPAEVQVFVNGVRVQTLNLPAGPQDIRNLPLSTGINDIQLIITDDLGQVQRLDFSASVAGNLLRPGLDQFSYNLGFPTELDGGVQNYDWNDPTLQASHRWGISDDLTLGGYLQANPEYQLLGHEGVWASPIGNWGWEVAASHSDDLGADIAARLQYEYIQSGASNPDNRIFRLAAEYRGHNFATLADLEPTDYTLELSAYYSQDIFDTINASLSGNYRIRPDEPDTYNIYLGLSRSFDNGLNASLNLNYGRSNNGDDEVRAFLGLYWLLPGQRQSVSLNTTVSNTDESNTQLSWSFSPDRPVQSLSGTVYLSQGNDSYEISGRLTYTNYRFVSELFQSLRFPDNGDSEIDNITQLTFGTALVFADGYWGWSRPVTNSFALIVPSSAWRDQVIGVNPSDNGHLAMVDQFGPAVIPDLQSYYISNVTLDAPEAPLGYDLGNDRFVLLPSYRSGTLIRAGTEATVFIRGTLIDASGNPVSLQVGQVVSLSDDQWQSMSLFTNQTGRFALTGFKPGVYEIRFSDGSVVQFEIPDGFEGLYDTGSLQLSLP